MTLKKYLLVAFLLTLPLALSGCSPAAYNGQPNYGERYSDAADTPDAIPKDEPLSRHGNASSYVIKGKRYHVLKTAKGYDKVGYASWYGSEFHGRHTSTRERYDMYAMTAASPTLPIPSYVRVTNLSNGRSAIVKVNDRGPFKSNRIIDLSYAAAKKLGYTSKGTTKVRVTAITPDKPKTYYANNDSNPVYLQVGSFSKRTNAEKLSKKLAASTQNKVTVKPTYKHKTKIYQVHIGPVLDTNQIALLKEQLKAYGYSHPIVVTG